MLLEVKNLSIEFHDHDFPEKVLEDISFSMDEGEILGVVGESGSGKSMTAFSIAGLLPRKKMKKSGSILFGEEDIFTMDRKNLRYFQGNSISVIFQEPMNALNPCMRIGRQVEEALRVHTKMSKYERRAEAIKVLNYVNLKGEEVYKMYPHELSGGMRQRVCIAAAIISEPKLLIADEPTTALDVSLQKDILELLKKINKEHNTGILFISHDLSLVKMFCEKVIVMKDGKIAERGNAKDIFENPSHEYTKKLIDSIPKVVL